MVTKREPHSMDYLLILIKSNIIMSLHFDGFHGVFIVFLQKLIKHGGIFLQKVFSTLQLPLLRSSQLLQLPHFVLLHAEGVLHQKHLPLLGHVLGQVFLLNVSICDVKVLHCIFRMLVIIDLIW